MTIVTIGAARIAFAAPLSIDEACALAHRAIGCPKLPVTATDREIARQLFDGKPPVGEWEETCAAALWVSR